MATVRFSAELLGMIRTNARDTFDDRLRKVMEVDPTMGDRMYDHAFKDYYVKMVSLPKEFFDYYESVTLERVDNLQIGVSLRFASPRPIPRSYPSGFKFSAGWNNSNIRYIVNNNDPIDIEFETYFKERQERIGQLQKQREQFVEGVMKVCESFTTLAPALKAWPPLWDLIPEAVKTRHLQVIERKSSDKKDALDEIDLTSMTATVIASKLVR